MFRYIILLGFIFNLVGCYWPPPSKGGYAAHYLLNPHFFRCSGPLTACKIHTDRLAIDVRELNLLRYSNAVRCHPARYVDLRHLEQQIAQEIAAQLYLSSQLDLNLFDLNLQNLKRLNALKGCRRVKNDNSWELLKLRIQ